jgi:putative ABC transport system ATP-binding protein
VSQLELHNLTLAFDDKTLFDNVSLTINQGDFIVIRGASGSGKSSFLRLLNRLGEPSLGSISYDGEPLAETEVTRYRRRVGYVQQTPILISGTVFDNLTLPFKFKASDRPTPDRSQLEADLESFNLDDVKLDDSADNLSVGQKQRIALIRTLLTEPEIILGDEPTSALDPESRTLVEDRLRQINREQKTTVILVTHLEFDLDGTPARCFRIDDGHLTQESA